MREILFRGKRADNGEWVYGVPIKKALAGSHDGYYPKIIPECDGRHQTIYSTAIKEETLGQYTGLTDKNGTKIFEGDILKTKYGRLCKVEWVSSPCDVCWDLTPIETKHEYADEYDLWRSINLEVIGNVHDNPELLEESK